MGSIITEDGRSDSEIKTHIALGKEAFQRLQFILVSGRLALTTKRRILQCYVFSILLYGIECWTISNQMKSRLKGGRNMVLSKNFYDKLDITSNQWIGTQTFGNKLNFNNNDTTKANEIPWPLGLLSTP